MVGCYMLKQYNIRMESTTYEQLKKLPGTVSENIRNAVDNYIHGGIQKEYDSDLVSILKEQIADLKMQRDQKERAITEKDKQIIMLSMGFWQRRKLLKQRNE